MATLPRTARYSSVAIAFHWTIALLVIVNLIIGLGHDSIPALKGWMPAHKSIGITVLVLTLGRLAWRLAHRPPALPAEMSGWERTAAHGAHWLLYTLLIALPLSGWMMVSGPEHRRPLDWFGAFPIPYLPVSGGAVEIGDKGHLVLGWSMLVLVVIHIAAALRHHLILRDSVLGRMLPVVARP